MTDMESREKRGMWANVERLVQSPRCAVCGLDTYFGGKGKFELCKKHNNWRTYLKLRSGK